MGIPTRSYRTGLMGISTQSYKIGGQTGLMGISTRTYKTGLMGGDTILGKGKVYSVKSVKISFKHSIVWHLKEIKEIKRPKKSDHFLFTFIFQNKLCMLCISTSFVVRAHPEEHPDEGRTAFFQQFSNFLFLFKDPYGWVF
jgi:hypothetical protein